MSDMSSRMLEEVRDDALLLKWKALMMPKLLVIGNTDTVDAIIGSGVDVDTTNSYGLTPLSSACMHGNECKVEILLARGANVNGSHGLKSRPLELACKRRSHRCVRMLIEAGARVDERDAEGRTLVHRLCEDGDEDIVSTVLEFPRCRWQMSVRDVHGRTPLMSAIALGRREFVTILLNAGDNPNAAVHRVGDDTPLSFAVKQNDSYIAHILMDAGADKDFRLKHNWTALYVACKDRLVDCADALVLRGADVNAATDFGDTPLHLLCLFIDELCAGSQIRCAEAIAKLHMNSKVDGFLKFPLMFYACIEATAVDTLLDNGVSAHVADSYGTTPLKTCISKRWESSTQRLLARGAHVSESMMPHDHTVTSRCSVTPTADWLFG